MLLLRGSRDFERWGGVSHLQACVDKNEAACPGAAAAEECVTPANALEKKASRWSGAHKSEEEKGDAVYWFWVKQ